MLGRKARDQLELFVISTPSMALRGLPRRGENLARARARDPARPRQHEDPGLPHGRGDQSQAARHRSSSRPVGHFGVSSRLDGPAPRQSCPHAPNRTPDDRRRLLLRMRRASIGFFNNPASGRFSPAMTAWLAAVCRRSCRRSLPSSASAQTARQHAMRLDWPRASA